MGRKKVAGGIVIPEQVNILQVDVEDWYCDLDISAWASYEDRVVASTNRILDMLKESDARATFFILGYVAERHPELVRRIVDESHEIGTHGYAHRPITKITPREFEEDLKRSIEVIEKAAHRKIMGFRAPMFTVTERTAWAIDILKRNRMMYDSSIFPVKTHMYGIPDANLHIYHPSAGDIKKDDPEERFLEVPLSVYRLPGLNYNIPVAGGFYLRFLPYTLISHAIRRINRASQPAVCYIHPWEIDPGHPRIDTLEWYHYYRLDSMEKRFKNLLKDFTFTSTVDYLQSAGPLAARSAEAASARM